jgi:hypothetical protein
VEPVVELTYAATAFEQIMDADVPYEPAAADESAADELSEDMEVIESELPGADNALASEAPEAEDREFEPAFEEEAPSERPRRGRRRGRRGQRQDGTAGDRRQTARRGRQQDSADLAQDRPGERPDESGEPAPTRDAQDEEDRFADRGSRPGSARSARRDYEDEEPLDAEETAPTDARADEEDQDDEEIDKLTDWNVPSWTELISSLYRPDR